MLRYQSLSMISLLPWDTQITPTSCHRLPDTQQQRAYLAWLNHVLSSDMATWSSHPEASLSQLQTAARVRALLWRVYQRDAGFLTTMRKVNDRVISGLIKASNAVRWLCTTHMDHLLLRALWCTMWACIL